MCHSVLEGPWGAPLWAAHMSGKGQWQVGSGVGLLYWEAGADPGPGHCPVVNTTVLCSRMLPAPHPSSTPGQLTSSLSGCQTSYNPLLLEGLGPKAWQLEIVLHGSCGACSSLAAALDGSSRELFYQRSHLPGTAAKFVAGATEWL